MDDLSQYAEEVLTRKSRKIEPLPEIKPYEVYAYQSSKDKDPFEPFFKEEPDKPLAPTTGGPQPDFNRNREELEAFPLDSLRMLGTLEKDDAMWGIVVGTDRTVYRVQVGNYMGRNHGKITNISEEGIDLTEIIPDGTGGYVEREASLALSE